MSSTKSKTIKKDPEQRSPPTPTESESPRSVVKAIEDVHPSLSPEDADRPKDHRRVRRPSSGSLTPHGNRRSSLMKSPSRQGSRRSLMAFSQSPQGSRRSLTDNNDEPVIVREDSRRSLMVRKTSRRSLMAFSRSPQGSRRSLNGNDDQQPEIVREDSRRSLMVRRSSLRRLLPNSATAGETNRREFAMMKSKQRSQSLRVLRISDMDVPSNQAIGPGLLTKSKSESHLNILKKPKQTAPVSAQSLVKSAGGLIQSTVGLATNTAKGGANIVQSGVQSSVQLAANTAKGGANMVQSGVRKLGGGAKGSRLMESSPINERTIYSSDMYSVDYVLNKINEVKKDQVVDSLVIEDLLVRGDTELNLAAVSLVKKTAMMPNDQVNAGDDPEKASLMELKVHVIAGEELADCDHDMFGKETSRNPYAIISLVSDDQPEFIVGRTHHCTKTLNPSWDINISKFIPPESFSTCGKSFMIQVKIMDNNLVRGDECMGIVQIPMEMPNKGSMSITPEWYVVPPKSSLRASGRIRVAVEAKCCYREILPQTQFERHWKKLTFYDYIHSAEDYERYTKHKREVRAKLRKVLKLKAISKMPIRFEAKVEAEMLNLHEMLELLRSIEMDDTILSLEFPGYRHSSSRLMDGGYRFHKDLEKLPGALSNKFDPTTLEWKENADPVLINIKYDSKPASKRGDNAKKRNSANLVRACSFRLLKLENSVNGPSDNWVSDEEEPGWDSDH